MVKANVAYIRAREKMLLALRQNSCASLKVFIDHDRLGETFIADDAISQRQDIPLSPFRRMKLLVFRVSDLTLICQQYPPNDKDCDSASALSSLRTRLFAQHHHSVWRHISYQYSFFSESECIFVEIEPGNNLSTLPFSFWEYPTRRLMSIARILEYRPGALRYFIVGNRVDGYQGIERAMDVFLRENEMEETCWEYSLLDQDKCKRLLFEL